MELTSIPADLVRLSRTTDWLIDPSPFVTGLFSGDASDEIVLTNGLISRTWRLVPNCATVGFDNLVTGEPVIRSIRPEARVTLDGTEYPVGGLRGLEEHAYLRREWIDELDAIPGAFRLEGYESGPTVAPFAWKRVRHAPDSPWPPPGMRLTFQYAAPEGDHAGVRIAVHYELYDGIPLLAKWIELSNDTGRTIRLNSFVSEILAAVEYESERHEQSEWTPPNLHVESDFGLFDMSTSQPRTTTQWVPDPQYTTQVNYEYRNPCLLESRPPRGPNLTIPPGEGFTSFRTFELAYGSTERERRDLTLRRMYRTIAPWVQENPILMHVRQADTDAVKLAVDQCAEVGFEMVVMTFGSGFDAEDDSEENIARMRMLADYARSKGIELGGYSLLASRSIDKANDAINPETGEPGGAVFENSPCLCSAWGRDYFRKLYALFVRTGLDVFEHDGSYAGDWCASASHPDHEGLDDSQWREWQRIRDYYHWCKSMGIYLNVPDWYMLSGSNKTGMGYREVNWSLPRERQVVLARQNMFDGTWKKTPSMGWMFLPLVEYHGGGADATLEPLSEHLDTYEAHLAQNFAYGVQSCYRGPRLYDTDETKEAVRTWVRFFKEHRAILESDIIHLKRPDGRGLDAVLHVNPQLEECAFLAVFNPLERPVEEAVRVPLYYAGIVSRAIVTSHESESATEYSLDRAYEIALPVSVEPRGMSWYSIRSGDGSKS